MAGKKRSGFANDRKAYCYARCGPTPTPAPKPTLIPIPIPTPTPVFNLQRNATILTK